MSSSSSSLASPAAALFRVRTGMPLAVSTESPLNSGFTSPTPLRRLLWPRCLLLLLDPPSRTKESNRNCFQPRSDDCWECPAARVRVRGARGPSRCSKKRCPSTAMKEEGESRLLAFSPSRSRARFLAFFSPFLPPFKGALFACIDDLRKNSFSIRSLSDTHLGVSSRSLSPKNQRDEQRRVGKKITHAGHLPKNDLASKKITPIDENRSAHEAPSLRSDTTSRAREDEGSGKGAPDGTRCVYPEKKIESVWAPSLSSLPSPFDASRGRTIPNRPQESCLPPS